MFKIQENADGSTSVYHKKTGQHMCTIPVKPNSSSPLRINVVEPQPSCNATVIVKDWRLSNFKTQVPDDSSTEESSSEDDLKSCCHDSTGDSFSDVSDEATSDSKAAFVRALDLMPADAELRQKGKGSSPLRRLSWLNPKFPRVITNLTPLSCTLGRRLLDEKCLVEKEPHITAAVRKYEGLCVSLGLPSELGSRLRCRQVAYPVCTTSRNLLRAESTHIYSYGRRQRRERLRVIETGLELCSRRLLAQCKDCEVRLERISMEEIKRWRRRTTRRLPPSKQTIAKEPQSTLRAATVRLRDITRSIVRSPRDGQYYLAGSKVRVLNYTEFLAARRPKPPLKPKNSNEQIPLIDLTLDPPPKNQRRATENCRRLVDRQNQQRPPNSKSQQRSSQPHPPRTAQVHANNPPSRQRLAQLNVGDPHPQRLRARDVSLLRPNSALCRRPANQPQAVGSSQVHGPVLRAMLQERQLPTHFRCFACGCNRFISGSNAELEVLEHMRRFHSVMDPDRFLTVYRDLVKRCTIVEAFPGYKRSSD